MSKLTDAELTEMKAIGYIEGNSATVPDALKVGQELRDKLDAHETSLARKQAKVKPAAATEPSNPGAAAETAVVTKPVPKKRQAKTATKSAAPAPAPVSEHHATPPAVQRDHKGE